MVPKVTQQVKQEGWLGQVFAFKVKETARSSKSLKGERQGDICCCVHPSRLSRGGMAKHTVCKVKGACERGGGVGNRTLFLALARVCLPVLGVAG